MPGLFLAQQVARPTDIQVVAREAEAGAQRVERLHDIEPSPRGLRQDAVIRQGQVGVGPGLRASDPAPQLVEL